MSVDPGAVWLDLGTSRKKLHEFWLCGAQIIMANISIFSNNAHWIYVNHMDHILAQKDCVRNLPTMQNKNIQNFVACTNSEKIRQ